MLNAKYYMSLTCKILQYSWKRAHCIPYSMREYYRYQLSFFPIFNYLRYGSLCFNILSYAFNMSKRSFWQYLCPEFHQSLYSMFPIMCPSIIFILPLLLFWAWIIYCYTIPRSLNFCNLASNFLLPWELKLGIILCCSKEKSKQKWDQAHKIVVIICYLFIYAKEEGQGINSEAH